ncbi:MAG: DUF1893 domain-containing protein [Oscillospiraceae bacterium]|nr:DUF1893 domain-containing protein [Oscillospiraceae bacterium]
MTDLENAVSLLGGEGVTCAVCKGDSHFTSTRRGVAPLLNWLDSGKALNGFCAADRVVGKATAMLYCLLGVRQVYARVISRCAAEYLIRHGIEASWELQVEHIQNRAKTGYCPMEQAVLALEDPIQGLAAIRQTLARLNS